MHSHKPAPATPVDAVRTAIWRLFQDGYVDEDAATASLLAVDLGTRRMASLMLGQGIRGQGPGVRGYASRTHEPRKPPQR